MKMKQLGHHENLVSLLNFGSIPNPGVFWMVLEFCDGGTLEDWLKDSATNPAGVADMMWRWWTEMAAGLAFLHEHGIVHHDLKPENIFMTSTAAEEASCKLGDFGLATEIDEHGICSMMGGTEA